MGVCECDWVGEWMGGKGMGVTGCMDGWICGCDSMGVVGGEGGRGGES